MNSGVDAIVIDTVYGHSKGVIHLLKEVKKKFRNLDVIVGNIATGDAAKTNTQADYIKVGIGPGSICTTRVIAGVGMPQLSAIANVASALKDAGIRTVDGGIRFTGDIPKALAAKK